MQAGILLAGYGSRLGRDDIANLDPSQTRPRMRRNAMGAAKRKRPCKLAITNHIKAAISFVNLPFVGADGIERYCKRTHALIARRSRFLRPSSVKT